MKVSDLKKSFSKLCSPAKFYLVLSLFSVILYAGTALKTGQLKSTKNFIKHFILMIVWTYILNWVCSFKYGEKISWFILFLPVLFIFGFMYMVTKLPKQEILNMIKESKDVDVIEGSCRGSCEDDDNDD